MKRTSDSEFDHGRKFHVIFFFVFFALPAPLSRTCLLEFCVAAHWYIASVSVRLAKTPTARCSFCLVFLPLLNMVSNKVFFFSKAVNRGLNMLEHAPLGSRMVNNTLQMGINWHLLSYSQLKSQLKKICPAIRLRWIVMFYFFYIKKYNGHDMILLFCFCQI